MITSNDNTQLKLIRKLADKKHRVKTGLLVAEGEDLVEAAVAAGFLPEVILWSGDDIEPEMLDGVSTLGSGTRVIGVFHQKWSDAWSEAAVSLYLHGVHDPGNVGTIMRSAHALADGPVVLGPNCADPWSPKAVRASMGSVFARPPAQASFAELSGATTIALAGGSGQRLADVAVDGPVVLCLGAERDGLPDEITDAADQVAHIPLRAGGPDSLNVAMAATVALYERTRMPTDA